MTRTPLEEHIGRALGKAYTRIVVLDEKSLAQFTERLERDVAPFCWHEVLGGRPLACRDIARDATHCHEQGGALAVDMSTCPSFASATIRLGADLALEKLAYSCGPSAKNIIALSCSSQKSPHAQQLRQLIDEFQRIDCAQQDLLFLAYQDFEQYWHAASDVARVVAAYLVAHPAVVHVYYPGLLRDQSDSSKRDSRNACAPSVLQGGFGPYLDVALKDQLPFELARGDSDVHQIALSQESVQSHQPVHSDQLVPLSKPLLKDCGSYEGAALYRLDCFGWQATPLILQIESLLKHK